MRSSSVFRVLVGPAVIAAIAVAGCDSDDPAPSDDSGPGVADTSVSTTSEPQPGATAAPNPDAGRDGAPAPTSQP